jgi:hypothetical protein
MARRTPPKKRIYNQPLFYLYDKWNKYIKQIEEEEKEKEKEEARVRREEEEYWKLQNERWEKIRQNIYELQTPEEKRKRIERIEQIKREEEINNRKALFANVSPSLKERYAYAGRRKTKRKGKSRRC